MLDSVSWGPRLAPVILRPRETSFRARAILSITALQVVILGALVLAALGLVERAGRNELSRQADTALRLATLLLEDAAVAGDTARLQQIAGDLVASEDFARIRVTDPRGHELAQAGGPDTRDGERPERRHVITRDGQAKAILWLEVPDDWFDALEQRARLVLAAAALAALFLTALVSALLGRYLTRHLAVIARAARQVAMGQFNLDLPERGPREFRAVARAMNAMSRRIGDLYADLAETLAIRTRTLESTFAHMTAGVAIFDSGARLVAANPAFATLLGFPPVVVKPGVTLDTLVDMHEALLPPGDTDGAACFDLCRRTSWTGPTLTFEVPFPDGRVIAVQRTRLPEGGFIATHEDVTQRREDQRRLLHAAKLATLGELATATAHELNQPLNVIRLSADNARTRLLAGKADADYLAGKLERIAGQTERAAAIIDHMRVFGRKPVEQAVPFDLSASVESAAAFFTETARLRGYRLDLDITSGLIVQGHGALIEQVVANLLSNAMAACAGRAADGTPAAIQVTVIRQDGRARVTVADNAGGVPPVLLPRIFEPFFTTKPGGEGTGLGLSISYGIVSDMGGQLTAENANGGAVFTVDLPLAR